VALARMGNQDLCSHPETSPMRYATSSSVAIVVPKGCAVLRCRRGLITFASFEGKTGADRIEERERGRRRPPGLSTYLSRDPPAAGYS
jgi:hypothetical protein